MAEQIHETTSQARAGETPQVVRYVLGTSLAPAIIAMIAVLIRGVI